MGLYLSDLGAAHRAAPATVRLAAIAYTRAIVDAIHSGALEGVDTVEDPIFGVAIPSKVPGVPDEILQPKKTWSDDKKYDEMAKKLARDFVENFRQYESDTNDETKAAGPRI